MHSTLLLLLALPPLAGSWDSIAIPRATSTLAHSLRALAPKPTGAGSMDAELPRGTSGYQSHVQKSAGYAQPLPPTSVLAFHAPPPPPLEEDGGSAQLQVGICMGILGLTITFVVGHMLELNHVHWVPEAAVGVLSGALMAGVMALAGNEAVLQMERFDYEFFMIFLLPPIIFEAGFNMDVISFLSNIGPTAVSRTLLDRRLHSSSGMHSSRSHKLRHVCHRRALLAPLGRQPTNAPECPPTVFCFRRYLDLHVRRWWPSMGGWPARIMLPTRAACISHVWLAYLSNRPRHSACRLPGDPRPS